MVVRLITIIILIIPATCLFGQDTITIKNEDPAGLDYGLIYDHRNCKYPELIYIQVKGKPIRTPLAVLPERKRPLLTATGEISYQHFGRNGNSDDLLLINSSSDIVTLRLGLLYKETYPFTFSFRYNQSRPFQMDNQYEVNIGFDDRIYRQKMREKLLAAAKNDFLQKQLQLTEQYNEAFASYLKARQSLKDPAYIQQAVESRLRNIVSPVPDILPGAISTHSQKFNIPDQWVAGLPGFSDLQKMQQRIKDSIQRRIEKLGLKELQQKAHAKLVQLRDSLQAKVRSVENNLVAVKNKMTAKLDSVNNELNQLSSAALKKYADKVGLKDSSVSNRWADIMMKTNVRLGKFLLNHSELTISNIFLHGISIRYGDEKFMMISGGFYDFAFRQVFNFRNNDTVPRNRPTVCAFKAGKTNDNGLTALSFYIGRKTKPGVVNGPLRTVAGFGLERKIIFNKNLSVDFEIAKSTTRPVNSFSSKNEEVIKDLFTQFSTRTIGIYGSAKVFIPATNTDAEISYRYWGQQFESFNASQYFNPQNSLSAKLSQPLFKRKVFLGTGIRYTDFSTFGIATNMKTKALFASANATVRLKKIPIISVGYYPGSQLYWLDQQKLYEYFYYILNATASHHLRVFKTPVQAVFTWNKFYNKYTDSVVAGARSYYNLFLTAWRNRFSYTTNISWQEIEDNRLTTIEAGLTYSVKQIKIGGSLKRNFAKDKSETGYSFCSGIVLRKIGTISFIYDKSYLPGRRGQFIPVKTGQVQIIKPLKFTLWE